MYIKVCQRHYISHYLVRVYHYCERDVHDGPGLSLPVSLHQSGQHPQHQTCGDLASLQPRLPLPRHPGQCHHPGIAIVALVQLATIIFYQAIEETQREKIRPGVLKKSNKIKPAPEMKQRKDLLLVLDVLKLTAKFLNPALYLFFTLAYFMYFMS